MPLENLLEKSEDIIHSEFGFSPKESKIKFYSEDSWNNFLRKRGEEILGIYHPRDLTAHISKSPEETLISRAIHEYFGHGSYCENTINGREIVNYEKNLRNLEEKLTGQKLKENLTINLIRGKNTKLIKSDNQESDYILMLNENEEIVKNYLELREKQFKFQQENILTYEGFAVWLENYLLLKLDRENIWKIRKQEISETDYETFYNKFKEFENKSGKLSLIYRTGFPKKFDKESILELLREHRDISDIEFLLLYGSRKDYSDIDLLAVTMNKEKNRIYSRDLDLIEMNYEEFINNIKLFDLETTEPLLTGELIIGNERKIEELKQSLTKDKFDNKCSNHYTKKIKEAEHYTAKYFFEAIKDQENCEEDFISKNFLYSLSNLAYVWSYELARKIYLSGIKTPVKLEEMRKNKEATILNEILDYTHKIKENLAQPMYYKTLELINLTKKELGYQSS